MQNINKLLKKAFENDVINPFDHNKIKDKIFVVLSLILLNLGGGDCVERRKDDG